MSNIAISNETDLDWLARDVHVWPFSMLDSKPTEDYVWHQPHCGGDILVVFRDRPSVFNKDQWLTRRAELQNKPSWEDAPEWAEWVAQDDDGEWKWLGSNPSKYINGWTANKLSCCRKMRSYGSVIEKGTILGDWRNTLEKRPEEFKPSIEEANRLAQEFKLLTGIEDNQEQDMKQDNKWFERGELPPVGTECEIDLGAKWRKAFVVGRNYTGRIVVEVDTCDFIVADGCTFRPIRTERDELLAVIVEEMNHYDTDGKLADAILAAGFSLRDK